MERELSKKSSYPLSPRRERVRVRGSN